MTCPRATIAAATLAAFAAMPASSPAGNLWDGGASNNDWTSTQNWSPNGTPNNDGTANLTFSGAVRLTPNLDTNFNIASLQFLNAGAFTFGSSNGSVLTIGSGGIAQNDNDSQTINHALALGASQTWNASSGNLLVGGAVNLAGRSLTTNGTFTTDLAGLVSGAGSITRSGGGTLRLAGANSYSGGTTLNAGTLVVANNTAVGTGGLTLGTATLRYEGNVALANAVDVAGSATISGPGVPSFDRITFSGALTGTGTLTFDNDASVRIGGSTATLFAGDMNVPRGTVTLGRTGGVNAVNGNLNIGTDVNVPDQGYVLGFSNQIHDAATVTVRRSGTLDLFEFNASDTIANLALVEGRVATSASGGLTVTGAVTSGNVAAGVAGTATVNGNLSLGVGTVPITLTGTQIAGTVTAANTLNLNAAVSGGAFSFEGVAGQLNLNGANTNNGFVYKNFLGRVDIGHDSALGVGSVTVDPDALIGAFRVVTGPRTVSNNFVLNYDAGFETLQGLTLGGTISGAGRLLKAGSGTLTLTNAGNTYTGQTHIAAGTVSINADRALGAVPASFAPTQINLAGGTLQASASLTLAPNRGINLQSSSALRANPGVVFTPSRLTGAGNITFISTNGSPITPGVFPLTVANTTFTGKAIIDGAIVSISQDGNLGATPGALAGDMLTLTNGGALKITATTSLNASRGVTLLNGGAGGTLDIDGGVTFTAASPITGAGNLTKKGPGTLSLASNTYTGRTIIDNGTVLATADANFGAAPPSLVADQLTLNAASLRWTTSADVHANRGVRLGASSSTIQVDTGATVNILSPVSGPGGLTKTGTGTLSFFGNNTYAGANSIGSGKVILNTTFSTNTSFAVSSGATLELATATPVTLKTGSITSPGKLDVRNNKIVLTAQPIGSWNGTAYTAVTGMIQSAFAGGAWTGNGITTSMDDAKAGLTTLAVATAEQTGYAGGTFGGVSVPAGSVLIMYTYAGDANLDGLISGDDYSAIDFNLLIPGARGYYNGDFNYDGVISGDDYSLIDFNIVAQGAPFPVSPSSAGVIGITAVPEPSAFGLAMLAAPLLARARARAHTRAPARGPRR